MNYKNFNSSVKHGINLIEFNFHNPEVESSNLSLATIKGSVFTEPFFILPNPFLHFNFQTLAVLRIKLIQSYL